MKIIDNKLNIEDMKLSGNKMKNNDRFELYENDEQFTFKKNKKVIEIKFNRVAFIFFVFLLSH